MNYVHAIGKLSMTVITLFQTSPPSEVCTKNYGPPKWRKSQFREFRDFQRGSPKKNDIWVQPPWPIIKNTIRGEGGGFAQVWAVVNLVSPCMPMACLCNKNAPIMH
jgi:hypothetical protein